ncbi:MAG: nucleoside-triphosphatase [Erysipelotrichaceae bacterium]
MRSLTLITGAVDAGKTMTLIGLFNSKPRQSAEGFATIKRFSEQDGSFIGYDLRILSTGEEISFIWLKEKYHDEFDDHFDFNRFVFAQSGFDIGTRIISEAVLDAAVRDLFIDEIGPLEIMGKGFSNALRNALDSDKNVTITINEKNVDAFVRCYQIDRYQIVACG